MPKKFDVQTTRKSITLPDELWALVIDYRHADRISTESEAVRRLLAWALERHPTMKKAREAQKSEMMRSATTIEPTG